MVFDFIFARDGGDSCSCARPSLPPSIPSPSARGPHARLDTHHILTQTSPQRPTFPTLKTCRETSRLQQECSKPAGLNNMTNFSTLGLVVAVAAAMSAQAQASSATYLSDAVEACASLNRTQKLGMMRGYGEIDGYTRNSGCGDLCGRKTFRWVLESVRLGVYRGKAKTYTTTVRSLQLGQWPPRLWRQRAPGNVNPVAVDAQHGSDMGPGARARVGHGDGPGVLGKGG